MEKTVGPMSRLRHALMAFGVITIASVFGATGAQAGKTLMGDWRSAPPVACIGEIEEPAQSSVPGCE